MNDKDLVLGVSGGNCDFKIVRLDDEKRDHMISDEIVNDINSGQFSYDFMDRIREICLSKARMKILSYLLINGISSPGKLHDELDIPLSTVYREIKYLGKMRLLTTIDQLNEGRGRPSSLVKVQQATFDQILERLLDAYIPTNRS